MPEARTVAEVRLGVLSRNLDVLLRLAGAGGGSPDAVPMVKANAYGHGLVAVARHLERHRRVRALGVASLGEAIALREGGVRAPLWVFSDAAPWNGGLARVLRQYRLTPVIHEFSDLKALLEDRTASGLRFHLKFNTGMNRLGVPLEKLGDVRRLLSQARGPRLDGLCTHFADAEVPQGALNAKQVSAFRAAVAELAGAGAAHIHCANTSAILAEKILRLGLFCTVVRPGIGLYGYAGAKGERLGLRPALAWRARVVVSRTLSPGAAVGYGATFKAKRETAQAVLALGYGDGLRRGLTNKRLLLARVQEIRVMGRVSMDLTSLEMHARAGDWVTILGEGEKQGRFLAAQAGTIEYEILTGISARVPRVYR